MDDATFKELKRLSKALYRFTCDPADERLIIRQAADRIEELEAILDLRQDLEEPPPLLE